MTMNKKVDMKKIVEIVREGDRLMIGGFGSRGYPSFLLEHFLNDSEVGHLTIYVNAPDSNRRPELEELIRTRCDKLVCTFMRKSKAAFDMFEEGKVELLPQGTFSESLRLGGAGIPAYYCPVGVGTRVAEGKEQREFEGKKYILERTFIGDVAFLHVNQADEMGNCFIKGSSKNFTVLMAGACRNTFVEAEEIVKVGEIDPELVTIPGILVKGIIKAGESNEY